jgi:hypothetical protein
VTPADLDASSAVVLAWLLTYAIHSTILLAVAAAIASRFADEHAWLDLVWKTALLGPLVTASLQVGSNVIPLGGRWPIGIAAPVTGARARPLAPRTETALKREQTVGLPASQASDSGEQSVQPASPTTAARAGASCGRRVVMAGDRRNRLGSVRRALSPPASGSRVGSAGVCCPSTPNRRRAVPRRERAISDTAHHEHDVCGPSGACRATDSAAGAISGAARRRAAAGRAGTRDSACGPSRSRVAHPGWSTRAGILLPAAEPRRPREALRVGRVPV